MKLITSEISFLAFNVLVFAFVTFGQSISSHFEIVTTYSQNEKFYLKSVPYDDRKPSLLGKSPFISSATIRPCMNSTEGLTQQMIIN